MEKHLFPSLKLNEAEQLLRFGASIRTMGRAALTETDSAPTNPLTVEYWRHRTRRRAPGFDKHTEQLVRWAETQLPAHIDYLPHL